MHSIIAAKEIEEARLIQNDQAARERFGKQKKDCFTTPNKDPQVLGGR